MAALTPLVSAVTDRGQEHPLNEDALFVASRPGAPLSPAQLAHHGYLLALADGGGGAAAPLVIQELVTQYYAQVGANVAENLRRAIHEVNVRVEERGRAAGGGRPPAGATLTAAVIRGGLLYLANVGDSRAYLLRAGRLWPLTRDHVSDNGTPSRLVGLSSFLEPDVFLPLALEPGDRLLLCSDGLTDYLDDESTLAQAAGRGTPETAGHNLISRARDAGSMDDVTVIVARISAASAVRRLTPAQTAVLGGMTVLAVVLFIWFLVELYLTLSA